MGDSRREILKGGRRAPERDGDGAAPGPILGTNDAGRRAGSPRAAQQVLAGDRGAIRATHAPISDDGVTGGPSPIWPGCTQAPGRRVRRRRHRHARGRQIVDAGWRRSSARYRAADAAGGPSWAVDPSSPFSGGALLGDRVRMQQHATDDGVFIRVAGDARPAGAGLSRSTAERGRRARRRRLRGAVVIETVGRRSGRWSTSMTGRRTWLGGGHGRPALGDEVAGAQGQASSRFADVLVVNKADREGARPRRPRPDDHAAGFRAPHRRGVATTANAPAVGRCWRRWRRRAPGVRRPGRG